jgi:hypothetical protein
LVLLMSQPAQTQGTWSGPFDWEEQLNPPPGCGIGQDWPEIAHAALIPVGAARGMMLLWGNECDNSQPTHAWIFDPRAPATLRPVETPINSGIFCSGHGWTDGRLLIAGAFLNSPDLEQSWLFDPRVLVLDTSVTPPKFTGNPWLGPYPTAYRHYYPSVFRLTKGSETSDGTGYVVPGGASIVLGGPELFNSTAGTAFWQFFSIAFSPPLPNGPGWSRVFHPSGNPPVPPPPDGLEPYYPITTAHGTPDNDIDSYPRAFQLAERGSGQAAITAARNIFVAGDVDTVAGSPPNPPGATVAIRPPFKTTNVPHNWELHATRPAGTSSSTEFNNRQYGGAAFMITREFGSLTAVVNRIFTFGGWYVGPGGVHLASNTVQEFDAQDQVTDGEWRNKTPMITARAFVNGVILPNRQLFLVGGSKALEPIEEPVDRLAFAELYDPGAGPGNPGSTQAAPPPNPGLWEPGHQSTEPQATPRKYHAVAGLLPDGSVWIAGGHQHSPPIKSEYTGEIFRPAYMALSRPIINQRSLGTLAYGQQVTIDVNVFHDRVERVVLTRPASVTHHCDLDQRLVELFFSAPSYTPPVDPPIQVTVTMPEESWAPPGWYMLWVLEKGTIGGSPTLIPSEACWVELQ